MTDFVFLEEQYNQCKKFFTESEKIVIISHTNPDGDAVGSAFALQQFFNNMGKEACSIFPNSYPTYLNCLHTNGEILFVSENEPLCIEKLHAADLIIGVDFNSPKRVGSVSEALIQSKAIKILIDHHVDSEGNFFNLSFCTIQVSSTSELIYWLLSKICTENFLNKSIAECLYAGICTDTGSFSYSSNFKSTYQVVIELIEAGVDTEFLHTAIYNNYSVKRIRLLGYCLKEKLRVMPDIGVAYIYLSLQDLNDYDFQDGDSEGIVNYTLSMEGINVGAMMTEYKDKIRISFRSKYDFDVNQFAKKYFGGGGHKKASGATYMKSMEKLLLYMEESFTKELKK